MNQRIISFIYNTNVTVKDLKEDSLVTTAHKGLFVKAAETLRSMGYDLAKCVDQPYIDDIKNIINKEEV